jgi:hypothetical protein
LGSIFPRGALADDRGWEYRPYRIQAILAIDSPGGLSQQLANELPRYLQRRVHAAIGPLWSFDVELATGITHHRVFAELANSAAESDHGIGSLVRPGTEIAGAILPVEKETQPLRDKLLLLAVRWTSDGFELYAKEFDRHVDRWGMPRRTECRQVQALPEQLFAITSQIAAPLVQFEIDPDDERHVRLVPRGAALVRQDSAVPLLKPGDVFLPVLRRTTRSGKLAEGGIQVIPWTYLEVAASDDEKIVARIHSGNRRPFGRRRQGRVEQVAIGLCAEPAETVLRLHSRTAPDKPLIGYQVFSQKPVAEDSDPSSSQAVLQLGMTDRHGLLSIPPGETRVRILQIKNGGQLLARLPVVPGAMPQIDVPLPDDDPRLAAEAKLAALREELVDVVARRNILMARARQKIKQRDIEAARKLLSDADQLPGRSQFNLTLTTAARTLRSKDPQIQRRIDQLVEATQTVMNQFLDLRPLHQLHDELRAARK